MRKPDAVVVPAVGRQTDGRLMVMAGILLAADAGGEASCAVITCPANDLVGQVHHRMPVELEPVRFDEWLAGAAIANCWDAGNGRG